MIELYSRGGVKMETIESLGVQKADPEIIELTKKVLEQNKIILDMNRDLLKVMMMPLYFVKNKL